MNIRTAAGFAHMLDDLASRHTVEATLNKTD